MFRDALLSFAERRGINMNKLNSQKNHEEYQERKLVLESYPRFLFLELTRNCNLFCSMCRPYCGYKNEWFMEDKVVDRVFEQLIKNVDVVDLRGFGESTLDPRLLSMADRIEKEGIQTFLFSNLCAQSSNFWKELGRIGTKVAVSIETANNEKYRMIRRGGELKVLKENVTALAQNAVREPYFSVVYADNNLEDMKALALFAKECGISKIQLNPISYSKPNDNQSYYGFRNATVENVYAMLSDLQDFSIKEGVNFEVAANLCNENNVKQRCCLHPWSYVFVRYDGSVGFCDHLARVEDSLMGNIMENDFMAIWNNETYVQLRKRHRDNDFRILTNQGIECEWCSLNRYANCEQVIEPDIKPMELGDYVSALENCINNG